MKKQRNHKLLFFGEVLKTFGAKGELIVKLNENAPAKFNIKEPIFIIIDGLLVPFYFKSIDNRGNKNLLVLFDDIENENSASELIGKSIYIPISKSNPRNEKEIGLGDLIGYTLMDKGVNEIGFINDFFDYPGNPCFQLIVNDKEVLIPINEDLINKIDINKKMIYIDLPDGLLDIYLS